jgi:hypothetical protein
MITIINRNGAGSMTLVKNANAGALIMTSAATPVTSAILTGTTSIVSQSPFAGGGNSYSLPASSTSYVYVPGQIGYAFGTGDFTIEWFQYENDANNFPRVFWYGSSPSIGVSIELGTFYLWSPGFLTLKSGLSQKNAWRHFALVRISGRIYLYYDGVIQNTGGTTYTTNITDTTSNFVWGAKVGGLLSEQFGGYLTNMRIVKGLGVYTGNFTMPTSALTAIASANPYGGANTAAIPDGFTKLLLVP